MPSSIVNPIRVAMAQAGIMSYAELARRLNRSYQHVYDVLNRRRFSIALAREFAELLNMPEDELVAWQRAGRERARTALAEARVEQPPHPSAPPAEPVCPA